MFSFSSLWLCLSLLSFASRATTHPTDISSSLSRLRSELFRPENRFLGQLRHRDDDDDDGAEYGDYGGGYGEYSEGADEAYSETTDDPADGNDDYGDDDEAEYYSYSDPEASDATSTTSSPTSSDAPPLTSSPTLSPSLSLPASQSPSLQPTAFPTDNTPTPTRTPTIQMTAPETALPSADQSGFVVSPGEDESPEPTSLEVDSPSSDNSLSISFVSTLVLVGACAVLVNYCCRTRSSEVLYTRVHVPTDEDEETHGGDFEMPAR